LIKNTFYGLGQPPFVSDDGFTPFISPIAFLIFCDAHFRSSVSGQQKHLSHQSPWTTKKVRFRKTPMPGCINDVYDMSLQN